MNDPVVVATGGYVTPKVGLVPKTYEFKIQASRLYSEHSASSCISHAHGSGSVVPSFLITFHAASLSWDDARSACQASGGDLASIHSAEENAYAYGLTAGVSTWLGLNDVAVDGNFVWSDGSAVDYLNWSGLPGAP